MIPSKQVKISTYFSEYEVYHSNKANELGINNMQVDSRTKINIDYTANRMDAIRGAFGEPIIVSSWVRVPALNSAVGGSSTSQHMTGEAVDFSVSNSSKRNNRDLFDFIVKNKDKFNFDQIILEYPDENNIPKWIHCSFTRHRTNRGKITAKTNSGYTHYDSLEELNEIFPYEKKVNKSSLKGLLILLPIFIFSYFKFK